MTNTWKYRLAWKYRRPLWKYRKQLWTTYRIARFSKPIVVGAAVGAGIALLQRQFAREA